MTSSPASEQTPALGAEAAAWLVRVQSDAATGDDWAALSDWLAQSEAHRTAFDAAEALSAELDALGPQILAGLGAPAGTVTAFRPRRPGRSWAIGLGLAAAVAATAGPLAWQAYWGKAVVYQTGPGETRQVHLADGSLIHMDAGSRLRVQLGWRARRVAMQEAQAAFDVSKDPGRPFLISVGDQRVRVVGTAFNIRHYDQTVTVTVRRGVVEVSQSEAGSAPATRLSPGDELRHRQGAPTSATAKVDPAVAFSWTEGRLIYVDQPLSDIAADLSRRLNRRITVAARAADKRFSGVLTLDDPDGVVDRLSRFLSLTVVRANGQIILS